jgi:hypothetical protein
MTIIVLLILRGILSGTETRQNFRVLLPNKAFSCQPLSHFSQTKWNKFHYERDPLFALIFYWSVTFIHQVIANGKKIASRLKQLLGPVLSTCTGMHNVVPVWIAYRILKESALLSWHEALNLHDAWPFAARPSPMKTPVPTTVLFFLHVYLLSIPFCQTK